MCCFCFDQLKKNAGFLMIQNICQHELIFHLMPYYAGAQAVQCFQKGIELMLVEKERQEKEQVAAACRGGDDSELSDRNISDAYLSIAEIYMTDCW